ncbi:hypothetical protein [Flagellimonas myxillae]|uniref:hypothetical protein n=1 Tax=Flagellimonas myxillae TaxID=2942214 RepID=UPI00201F1CFF|nr:hypothetical protein [Muricauda myxillae]MCL6266697.1 hypothetical protein [Muricauda myxillae]
MIFCKVEVLLRFEEEITDNQFQLYHQEMALHENTPQSCGVFDDCLKGQPS